MSGVSVVFGGLPTRVCVLGSIGRVCVFVSLVSPSVGACRSVCMAGVACGRVAFPCFVVCR